MLGSDGPLAERIPGFAARRPQQDMAHWVAGALAGLGTLVVEAGTGTGKTYAYLVPALLSGRHVIISTGTRTLQDQLFHRDLPAVAQALGRPVKVAVLKGRSNYLCLHRLKLATQGRTLDLSREARSSLERVRLWSRATRSGELSEVPNLADQDPVWPLVTSTRENCLGGECAEFSRCHLIAARREAQAADIVIVNHHLLLADLALKEEGFGDLLPGTDALIIDEAHQIPDIAGQFFGLTVGSRSIVQLARDALAEGAAQGPVGDDLAALLKGLEASVVAIARNLGRPARLDWAGVDDAAIERLTDLAVDLENAARALEALGGGAGIGNSARRASEIAEHLGQFLALDAESGLRWVDVHTRGFALVFTPFEVAGRMRELIKARPTAWIFTSATLAVGEDFQHFTRRLGLDDARTVQIPSPFDFERQARLYLPAIDGDPNDPEHPARVVEAAWPLVEAAGGRAFLLFTSHRALAEAARLLRAHAGRQRYPLLVQGEAPREVLLRRFRELGNAVLLGTSSFWEGVDVKGDALCVVVIDKLPFASPDDPVLKARIEGIRRRGGNPFVEHQLPQAALALKQGAGRLIRDASDFGVIAICDPRVTAKSYGRVLLASLPPMPIVRTAAEAAAFLRERLAQSVARAV
ncbi:MAG TPA: ATP-dependent DNA helicase [Steroidobacteraceae bacterium]|nr:ATP-dependent DNA helicase [Steroidobacteraceae bacterium]